MPLAAGAWKYAAVRQVEYVGVDFGTVECGIDGLLTLNSTVKVDFGTFDCGMKSSLEGCGCELVTSSS